MKAKGQGLFAKKKFSPALGAIVGKPGGSRIDAVKGVWAYIKKNKLNKGRNISADAKLKGVAESAHNSDCARGSWFVVTRYYRS
jgi:chromatin remodeling complex protein RSC6